MTTLKTKAAAGCATCRLTTQMVKRERASEANPHRAEEQESPVAVTLTDCRA